jgi:hypothetical protein
LRRDIAAMQAKHLWDWSSAPKTRWYGEVQPCRIGVGEIVEAERGLVAEDPRWSVAPVARPEHPEDQVRPVRFGEARQPVNPTMFANPITCADVVDSLVAGVSERRRLLRCEVATLRFRELVEILLSLEWRLQRVHKRSIFWTYYARYPDADASLGFHGVRLHSIPNLPNANLGAINLERASVRQLHLLEWQGLTRTAVN